MIHGSLYSGIQCYILANVFVAVDTITVIMFMLTINLIPIIIILFMPCKCDDQQNNSTCCPSKLPDAVVGCDALYLGGDYSHH